MSRFLEDFEAEIRSRLARLATDGLYRRLAPSRGLDFSSNDYLGLARDPVFARRLAAALSAESSDEPLAPASRLLRGTTPLHLHVERRLAEFKRAEAALLFASGYQANLGALTTLIAPGDIVLSDAANHASIIDGLRLARAEKVIFPHRDVDTVRSTLAGRPAGARAFVVTESLFSMDGDIAPLDDYAELCSRHDAGLIIDDAHATGVFGDARGSGLAERFGVERESLATISTFGKALALAGACVSGPSWMVDYLVQRARSFIYTTATPPLFLRALETSLDIVRDEPERRARVLRLATRLRDGLRSRGVECPSDDGPIVPIVLGTSERALEAAAEVTREGFDVRAVRPPSVPAGTSRLRLSVHASHREEEIDTVAEAVARHAAPLRSRP